jgi:hypothetical protein
VRNDEHAGGGGEYRQVLRRGAGHGHLEALAFAAQREGAVLLGERGRQQRQRLIRHGLQLLHRGRGQTALLGQRERERVQVEVAQPDQVGAQPQPSAVVLLNLEGLIQLLLVDESLANEERSKHFGHARWILVRLARRTRPLPHGLC